MYLRLKAPILGMIEGVAMPRDPDTVFELPDHAARELIAQKIAEQVEAPYKPAPEVEAKADADVEVRVVEAAEKRGPGRPPAAK